MKWGVGEEEGLRAGVVVRAWNLHTWEAEAGGSGIQAIRHYTVTLHAKNKHTGCGIGSDLREPELGFPQARRIQQSP